MKKTLCFLLIFLTVPFFAYAQGRYVPDLRARSRRGGVGQTKPVPQQQSSSQQKRPQQPQAQNQGGQAGEVCPSGTCGTAGLSQPQEFKQTGTRQFRKEDEDKVLNFDVQNPEFDKLSDKQKADVMNRIKIEMD